jgi:arylformamidase
MRRIDVSMPLADGMPVFPGDTPFESSPTHGLERGDPYRLSRLVLGSHAGTHIDPPSHFLPGGTTVDQIDLDVLQGTCEVLDVPAPARAVGPADVARIPSGTTRVLFRTSNSARWARERAFFPDYVAVAPEAAAPLLARGIRLVGIDSLSLESDPTGRFPVHHTLLSGGALILEGLLLADAAPGTYELECLPLRLRGGDGGPARAVLVTP